jgi:hypothetical protein
VNLVSYRVELIVLERREASPRWAHWIAVQTGEMLWLTPGR